MLAERLTDLKALQETTFDEYQQNRILRGYVERSLQVCIQICLDTGAHLIAEYGFRRPRDNRDVFTVLLQEKIISSDLHDRLGNMAGFRNIIVHDYTEVDDAIVYNVLQEHLVDFEQFATAISVFISDK